MVLTRAEVSDIALECFAGDVPYQFETLKHWDEERVRQFFEAGGERLEESVGPFYAPLWNANQDVADRLLALQPAAEGGDETAPPLDAEEAHAIVALFSQLEPSVSTVRCRRFIALSLLRSLSRLGTDAEESVLGALYDALALLAFSTAPGVRIDLGKIWNGVTLPPQSASRIEREPLDGSVGVLLLGFGGSTLAAMRSYEKHYAERWPSWIVMTHAGPLLAKDPSTILWDIPTPEDGEGPWREMEAEATTRALDELMSAVCVCESLVVHVLSNQGHMVWLHLMRREWFALYGKVKAIVFDCAANERSFFSSGGGSSEHSDAALIDSKSLVAILFGLGIQSFPTGISAVLERCSRISLARRMAAGDEPGTRYAAPGHAFDWEAKHEPGVPTLCLTSEDDSVIKAAGVRAFAEKLRAAQPERDVSVEELNGKHVMLAHTDTKNYMDAISRLAVRAALF